MLLMSKLGKELAFEKKETMKEKDRIFLSIRTLAPLLSFFFFFFLLLRWSCRMPLKLIILMLAQALPLPIQPRRLQGRACLPSIGHACPLDKSPAQFFGVWFFLGNGWGEGRNQPPNSVQPI
jgi:hypothetical protein